VNRGATSNGVAITPQSVNVNGLCTIYAGAGAPSFTAPKGSLYLRTNGSGTGDRAYINTDGMTTWTALTTAA
jgi:hypothetical protein